MLGVHRSDLPAEALLQRYVAAGAYTDCYATQARHAVSHGAFVEAFYTTALFKLERAILRLASRPSTDADAARLARGEAETFAAWSVEARSTDQLLLRDFTGRTRSWLMVAPASNGTTRLLFGSAVVPIRGADGRPRMGAGFSALLGFHKIYSQALLAAARRRLSA